MHRLSLHLLLILTGLLCVGGTALAGGSSPRQTKVHLDKPDALTQVFPDADRVVELRYVLSSDETARIESSMGRRIDEGGFYLYAAFSGDTPVGYAAIVSQLGKVKPITHIVGVTPDGTVSEVAVMIYRESHGDEVADTRFMEQYEGKSLDDPIRIDRDIINIAGATLSGHAICRGVRKALAVVDTVFLSRNAEDLQSLLEGAEAVTPAALDRPTPVQLGSTRIRREREVMGTVCTIEAFGEAGTVEGDQLDAAITAALDEVAHWDQVLSNWRTDTPLSQLNAAPVGEPFQPGDDLLAWLEDARGWSAKTGYRFDPAVGSLVQAWSLQSGAPSRPDADTLEEARNAAGMSHFLIDTRAQTVSRLRVGALLDPGASGKGYALDRAAAILRAHGVRRALLSFRSTLLAMGPPPGEAAWNVPIVHDGPGEEVAQVELVDSALSVSGGSMRGFDDGETLRGHVIDPCTGVPVEAARLAWVTHPSAAASDALATALLVEGPMLPVVEGAAGGFLQDAGSPVRTWPTRP